MTALHPGPITNAGLLQQEDMFLKGTGTIAGFEKDVMDTYLHKDTREKMHFEFFNKEIWDFLNSRYGCDQAIKRYYVNKGTYSTFCEIDSRLTKVPTFIVYADQLFSGSITRESFKPSYVQLSSKKNFTDLKKRLADVATALLKKQNAEAEPITPAMIRLWISESSEKLIKSFSEIANSEQRMDVDGEANGSSSQQEGGKSNN